MNILVITHGRDTAPELFARIGELACARATHADLGVCVTSEPGRIWLIAEQDGATLGFASIHPLANKAAGQLKHLYAPAAANTVAVLGQLLRAVVKEARRGGITTLTSNDRLAAARIYAVHGWQPAGTRGQYTTYHWSAQ